MPTNLELSHDLIDKLLRRMDEDIRAVLPGMMTIGMIPPGTGKSSTVGSRVYEARIEQLEAELLEVRTCLVIAMSFWPESSMREEAELSARCRRSECRRNADSC